MEKTWRLIIDGAREPEANMAVDEAIMLYMAEGSQAPTMRIYRWPGPCVSVGKFQRLDDAPLLKSGIPMVRRPTGGGSVFHDGSGFTYSLVYREDSGVVPKGAAASYRHIHEGVAAALKGLGLEAGLFVKPLPAPGAVKVSNACFASPVESDVVSGGKKVAGAAQRRRFGVVLHEGEVSLPLDVWRKYPYNVALNVFIDSLSKQLQARFLESQISEEEDCLARELLMDRMEEVTK